MDRWVQLVASREVGLARVQWTQHKEYRNSQKSNRNRRWKKVVPFSNWGTTRVWKATILCALNSPPNCIFFSISIIPHQVRWGLYPHVPSSNYELNIFNLLFQFPCIRSLLLSSEIIYKISQLIQRLWNILHSVKSSKFIYGITDFEF